METFERIKEIRKHFFHDNNIEFAEFMNEKASTTSGWVSGRRGIGKSVLDKILSKLADVNPTWLLTGEGKMLINTPQIPNTYVNGMSANYQGHFSQPIHTEIGNTNQSREEGKYLEIERELFRLREENARLLIQLEYKDKLIEEKDKVIEEKGRFIEMILTKS